LEFRLLGPMLFVFYRRLRIQTIIAALCDNRRRIHVGCVAVCVELHCIAVPRTQVATRLRSLGLYGTTSGVNAP